MAPSVQATLQKESVFTHLKHSTCHGLYAKCSLLTENAPKTKQSCFSQLVSKRVPESQNKATTLHKIIFRIQPMLTCLYLKTELRRPNPCCGNKVSLQTCLHWTLTGSLCAEIANLDTFRMTSSISGTNNFLDKMA